MPDKTAAGAAECYMGIGVEVTERWLKAVTDRKELTWRIVAGQRMYSTAELWRVHHNATNPHRRGGAPQPERQ